MWKILLGDIKEVEQKIPELQALNDSIPDIGSGQLGLDQLIHSLLLVKGEFKEALDYGHSKIEWVRQVGDLQRLESMFSNNILVSIITNDPEVGISAAEEMVQLAEKGIASDGEAHSLSAIIFSRQGDLSQARNHYQIASGKLENPPKGDVDRIWIGWANAELLLVENKWAQAWDAFENLHSTTLHKGFIWHANMLFTEWGLALLMHGNLDEKVRAQEMLKDASEKFQVMGADGWVRFIEGKMDPIS
jgi:hypothetical protein